MEIGNLIYVIYALFGLLPSFIWLIFYLRKDKHPEPNRMVLTIFLFGMLTGPIAIVFELFARWLLNPVVPSQIIDLLQNTKNIRLFANIVFAAPIVEEVLKFSVVKFKILKNSACDEPLDVILYMIVAALGFAAVENLLLIFQTPLPGFGQVVTLSAMRFASATFVHALASGMLGYWLAQSIRYPEKKFQMLARGFGLAIFFHASYNFLIWFIDLSENNLTSLGLISMVFILIGLMAIAVAQSFSILKKSHSVCHICKTKLINRQTDSFIH